MGANACFYTPAGTRGGRCDEEGVCLSGLVNSLTDTLTSHQYKSYRVGMVHRLWANCDVQLGNDV